VADWMARQADAAGMRTASRVFLGSRIDTVPP
jgi:hypothetical protein